MSKIITIDIARGEFKNRGFVLLENEYKYARIPLECKCNNGHITKISLNGLKNGSGCKFCNIDKNKELYKLDFNYVKKVFIDNGCECLEDNYKNNHTKMRYRCNCGNISFITFSSFKSGSRCSNCVGKRISEKKRLDIEYVRDKFIEEGCIPLFNEYINAQQKLKYICSCGNESQITFNGFCNGHRCRKCGIERSNINSKHSLEYVKNKFVEGGCIPLFNEYIDARTKLKYQCSCGNISYTSFDNLMRGHRCKECGIIKFSDKIRHSLEFVKEKFIEGGCVPLFNEYKGCHQKLKYKCECGNISFISYNSFSQGHRCRKCGSIKSSISQSGSNNYNWQGGKSYEPYCCVWKDKEYKESIKERDNYMCLNPLCNKKYDNKLTIHHLDYNKLNCHPKNLITLCTSCNTKANFDREWHQSFYSEMVNKRYYNKNKIANMLDI